jgi:serine O-acetyltransferase
MPKDSYALSRAWLDLLADLDRYRVTEGRGLLAMFVLSPGSVASVAYRLSRWVWSRPGPFAHLARIPLVILHRLVEIWSGVSIYPQAKIGPGLYIGHFGGVIVHGQAVLGANCNLSQSVTIGVSGRGGVRGVPTMGDRVYIGPGAKLFGPIVIGDDVAIGANAVVVSSVPTRGVVVGVPGKVRSREGSFEFVRYRGMDDDPARQAALTERAAGAVS